MAKQSNKHLSNHGGHVALPKDHAYPITQAHTLAADHLASLLQTNLQSGLSDADAKQRIGKYGSNSYEAKPQRSVFLILVEQLKSPIILLLVAAAISFFLGSDRDGLILMQVVFFNALIGFYQDWKSENILASLKDLLIERCLVIRAGRKIEVPSEQLVPGDLLSLHEGDGIPADIRLLDSSAGVSK